MSVSFNEEPRYTRFASQPAKGIAGKLVEWKFAKDARQANYILIILIVICFGLIIWLTFFSGTGRDTGAQVVPPITGFPAR
jgi:hypothetical protein